MGSLSPHDTSGDGQRNQQWVTDPLTNCIAADPDFTAGDSISWKGRCWNKMAFGPGTLTFLNNGHPLETVTGTFTDGLLNPGHVTATWPDGTSYDGDQLGGLFNGTGKFVSTKGDTFDGEWKLGALNGNGTVHWANGDHYQGTLKNGMPDGNGVEVWANGNRYEGAWRDGQPVARESTAGTGDARTSSADSAKGGADSAQRTASPEQPAPPTATPASFVGPAANHSVIPQANGPTASDATQNTTASLPLRSLLGVQLVAVDGAGLSLGLTDDGFERTLVLPNGTSQRSEFAFANGPVGTVSDDDRAVGVFRAGANQLDIDYADGVRETIVQSPGGGLVDRAKMADGHVLCAAWYPQGHGFSQDEKKVAVQEYASRLGIAVNAQPSKHRERKASETCGGAFLLGVSGQQADAAEDGGSAGARPISASTHSSIQNADSDRTSAPPAPGSVSVATSAVHLIDAPDVAPAKIEPASFTPGSPLEPMKDLAAESQTPMGGPGASDCLNVSSNGEYWGFQNRCAKVVQFAYCEMSEANPLTSCKHTSVSGSVAANGFSALVSDRSLGEKSVNHEFRWMACNGGAGEVVAHLDKVDPPSGRCERAISPAN